MTHYPQPVVYRQLAIPVQTFDRIKDYQRHHEATKGQRLTIAQVVAAIVQEHFHQTAERESQHEQANSKPPAILRRL